MPSRWSPIEVTSIPSSTPEQAGSAERSSTSPFSTSPLPKSATAADLAPFDVPSEWSTQDLAAARARFLRTGQVERIVRPHVREAWERCRAHGVDPQRRVAQPLDRAQWARRLAQSHRLLEAAASFLEAAHGIMGARQHLWALADEEGWILHLLADGKTASVGAKDDLFEGACWHERAIGCNGIGTALATGRPVVLIGPEHFQDRYAGWTCIGIPLRDGDARIVGALDLSVPNESVDIQTWGWALSIGQGIESRLREPESSSVLPTLETPFNALRGVIDLLARQMELSTAHRIHVDSAREELAAAEAQVAQLRRLMDAVSHVQYRERARIADLFHGDLQQLLVAVKAQVQLEQSPDAIVETLDRAIRVGRSLAQQLAPPPDADLQGAAQWVVDWLDQTHGFRVRMGGDAIPELSEGLRLFAIDSIRELLLNAVKHSGTDEANLGLALERDGAVLRIEVVDRGFGFDPTAVPSPSGDGGLGLAGLRERARLFGGTVELHAALGSGTRVVLRLPIV